MIFAPDRGTYLRTHWTMAAIAMAIGMIVLALLGSPHVWTGAVGGLAAVVLRGWYLMDEELARIWTLGDTALQGPGDLRLPLTDVAKTRIIGAAVQMVTRSGDKHLIKFQATPDWTRAQIEAARRQALSQP